MFDDNYELLHDHLKIKTIKELTNKEYYARGCTALLDAIGKTINSIGRRLANTSEDERPEKVIIVITTDGFENSSKEFSKTKIKEMIEHQQSKYNWTFIFLGANMDAVGEATSLGINPAFSKTYTANKIGTQSVYNSVTKAMSCMRSSSYTGDVASASYKTVMDSLDEVK